MIDYKNITNRILCEDIRTEDNGKGIIIGAFGSRIIISEIPATLQIAVYFELEDLEPGQYNLFVRTKAEDESGETPQGATIIFNFTVNLSLPEILQVKTPRTFLQVTSSGHLVVDVSFDNIEWFNIIRRKIEVNTNLKGAFSISGQLPS